MVKRSFTSATPTRTVSALDFLAGQVPPVMNLVRRGEKTTRPRKATRKAREDGGHGGNKEVTRKHGGNTECGMGGNTGCGVGGNTEVTRATGCEETQR